MIPATRSPDSSRTWSDHGASPMPERVGGGRITFESLKDAANRAAIAELGPGEWIASARYPTLYLTAAARAQKPRELTIATTKIVYALRSFPGIERVEKSAELWGDCERRTGDALARMALAARRHGCRVELWRVRSELLELLDLAGLAGLAVEVVGQAEEREEAGRVEEERDPGDPVA